MKQKNRDPYYRVTEPFVSLGEKMFVEVVDSRQTIRRCQWKSKEPFEPDHPIRLLHT